MNIIPAVLPHNFQEITEKLSRIEGLVTRVQIDICDGVFGREKTWLPDGTETLPAGFSYEFDVMLNDWRMFVMHCLTLGAKSIVAHVDMFSDEDITTLLGMVSPHSASLGIAVSNDKSLDFHSDMIRKARALYPHVFIQVMGIKQIGEQGQVFDEDAPGRVKALKQQFGDVQIQVDGGIVIETGKLVAEAGADAIVVGSYIFGHDDAGGMLEQLNAAVSS
jgi:ribulose-phosphate 3-epimerase